MWIADTDTSIQWCNDQSLLIETSSKTTCSSQNYNTHQKGLMYVVSQQSSNDFSSWVFNPIWKNKKTEKEKKKKKQKEKEKKKREQKNKSHTLTNCNVLLNS